MSATLNLFRKHPVAIVFLILYTLCCIRAVMIGMSVSENLKLHPDIGGVAAGGEAAAYVEGSLLLMATIFFMICCGYAIAKKEETRFYLWVILIIAVETITVFNIS